MNLAGYSDSSDEKNSENNNHEPKSNQTLPANQQAKKSATGMEKIEKKLKVEDKAIIKPVRNVAHTEGNFSSTVYIRVSLTEGLYEFYQNLESFFKDHDKNHILMIDKENLHISLSKTIYLNYHQIDRIVEKMQKAIESFSCFPCSFGMNSLKIFANEQKTRTFLSLLVKGGKIHFFNLIDHVNKILESFKAETFFKDPQPHVSLSWSLEDIEPEIIQKFYEAFPKWQTEAESIEITEIIFQIGQRLNVFKLKKSF